MTMAVALQPKFQGATDRMFLGLPEETRRFLKSGRDNSQINEKQYDAMVVCAAYVGGDKYAEAMMYEAAKMVR